MLKENDLDYDYMHNRKCLEYLRHYKDNPEFQERIIKYSSYPDILYEDFFMISMLGIEDTFVEEKLLECFSNNLINSLDDFIRYKNEYQQLSPSKTEMKLKMVVY